MIRTAAGSLRAADAEREVSLAGWVARRRDHGGVAFIDLRDASGVVQVVVRDEAAHGLRAEYCIKVIGTVRVRPEGNENPELPTGAVEVVAEHVEVLSTASARCRSRSTSTSRSARTPACVTGTWTCAGPPRPTPCGCVPESTSSPGTFCWSADFVEVETPTLTRSTPEGARDFLVPVRLQPGHWYALPQSPQLFKQLLMVAGLERYFQIARCYRDEDFRADRQPEFTQLDIEMSFVEQDDVIAVGEAVVRALWQGILGYEIGEIPRMTYAEAMRRYGSDKPDLRFDLELTELTDYFAQTPFRVFQAPYVGAIVMPGGGSQPRRAFDAWQEWAKQRGARGLAYVTVAEDGTLGGPVAKNISEAERDGLVAAVGADPGDCIFFAAGKPGEARGLLAAARDEIARRLGLIDESAWSFLWIVDAPMFEEVELDDGSTAWTAVHHPFTSPNAESLATFDTDPAAALAWAYDLVCNGNEIGGGSIRIHQRMCSAGPSRYSASASRRRTRSSGSCWRRSSTVRRRTVACAYGWDRICMLLAGASSLRDVIAFPKTGAGHDPLTGAPATITPEQRAEAGVDFVPEDDAE